jgi:phosphoglycerate dehydrogenase-like enzyme
LLPESEQILYEQVLNHPKIQMSPHIGGWTYRSKTEIENALLNSLRTWMQEKGYTPQ